MEKITTKNYVENVLRTESNNFKQIQDRLLDITTIRLLHAGMGLTTEAGECLDMLKKHIFYGKEIDYINLKEEIGDIFWYIGIVCHILNCDIEDILTVNIEKLKARYPEKFTSEKAINRDLDTERKILSKDHIQYRD